MRRMGKIVGRSDDMLIIRGVNLFPTQIEEIVLATASSRGSTSSSSRAKAILDAVEVRCEVLPQHARANRDEVARQLRHRSRR
jgi:phenylacetate-CoA ligase